VIPLTFTVPAMGPIGKGVMTLITRGAEAWHARVVTMTAIYSALDLRDASLNDRVRDAFMKGLMPEFSRMRRDAHQPSPECWLHGESFCFTK
jgi:hypothetical protein